MSTGVRSTCLSPFCGARIARRATRCPGCGRSMHDDADVNRRGWRVFMLGLILTGLMGGVTWFTAPTLLRGIAQAPGSTFAGPPVQAFWILLAFLTLVLTGGAFIATSVMMIRGWSSRLTTIAAILLFGLGVVFVVLGIASGPPARPA